jgi:alkanesulfonate monooxygenase SsuD/methylene tetrahydromethanopterin reductase-like flavin-dependent oxidoreductase (luciferase family)
MMKIGIDYHLAPSGAVLDPAAAAHHAEQLGFDSIWTADNLARENKPILECMLILATAGAVTNRIGIGVGVMQVAIRATAWVAKQVATMQVLTNDRFLFGVGAGGTFPDEWAVVGMSTRSRGRRTDAMLEVLPSVLAGKPTVLPESGSEPVTMQPACTVPPIWVGGQSPAALKRVARYGDGWLPALFTPEKVASARAEVAELAASFDRPAPQMGVQLHGDASAERGSARHNELVTWMSTRFRQPQDQAERLILTGNPAQVAERLHEYREAGADLVVISPLGEGWMHQAEKLAEARRLILA